MTLGPSASNMVAKVKQIYIKKKSVTRKESKRIQVQMIQLGKKRVQITCVQAIYLYSTGFKGGVSKCGQNNA